MKIGSLFDGSGGFPLAGALCDIVPIWASEIEPYPIAVTKSRFPNMKHLGDISKINGADIEPVDIITFGSPCQDMSVAGKRAGIKHEVNGDEETTRSGLFMEAVRIIKEMRGATNGKYPRFAVWENVPGAFSSNKGEDFRLVLEELIKVTEPNAVMPEVPTKGWAYADSFSGDGWSLAYRVLDAQYWGVPQRRRRIYLVADFRGECAGEILFEREGLRGYFAEGRTPWQGITTDAERSVGADDREGAFGFDRYNQCSTGAVSETVRCPNGGDNYPTVCYGISSYDSNAMKSSNPHSGIYEADTARTLDNNGGNPSCNQGGIAIVEGVDIYNTTMTGNKVCSLTAGGYGSTGTSPKVMITDTHILDDQGGSVMRVRTDGKAPTIRAQMGGHPPVVMIPNSAEGLDAYNQTLTGDKAKTLNSAATDSDHIPCTVYSVENHPADSRVTLSEDNKVQTLTSRMGTGGGNVPMVMENIRCFDVRFSSEGTRNARGHCYETTTSRTVDTNKNSPDSNQGSVAIVMEEKPRVINLNKNDVQSKAILDPKGIAPALYAGECRGGGGECYVMATQQGGAEICENLCPTITAAAGMSGNNQPVVCLEGNGQRPSHKGNGYAETDKSYTLNTTEVHGVVYAVDQGAGKSSASTTEDLSPTLACTHDGAPAVAYSFDPSASRDVGVLFIEECGKTLTNGTCPGHHDGVVIAQHELLHASKASFFMKAQEGAADTLVATDYKDPQLVCYPETTETRYIVRRLTPTECARLQGFPDAWGHIESKADFTDEEYKFWLEVRNTHAEINGKQVKDYTKKQMLIWYNKLHTDSAEYKLWGNGIALPNALYVMQGIADVMKGETND